MFKVLNRKREQVDILENPISPVITNELGGIGELTFSVPATYKHLELEGYIIVENDCEYVIKEIVTHGMNRQVMCILNVEEIIGMAHATFYSKDNDIDDTMKIILNGTKWRHENKSKVTEKRNLYGTATNSYNMLQLMTTVFGVEFEFDTHRKVVIIADKIGSDKGVYFTNDLNLRQLNQDTHSHKFITRLIPIGKDGLLIDEVNDGKQWIANHKYSDKEIYGIWQSSNIEDPNILKRDGERFLEEMCIPYETYEVVIRDLYQLADNENFDYELGDVVTIIDSVTETRIQQRVIKKTRNLQDPNQDTINIANKDQTFQDYYKRLQTIADMTEGVINQDGSINGGSIGSIPSDKIEGDIPIDKIVGDIVADSIVAGSITADHIKANQIQTKHLVADSITADHIQADSIDTKHLKADSIVSEHIQAGIIQAGHIQAGSITAGSGIIADGAIGSAQISKLDANKIEAGTIDTSKVTVAGANSNLLIRGNRLQVFDGIGSKQVERVSLGDVNNDGTVYGFRVRGKDGKTVLLDENGVKSEGITDGSITNDKISGEANIDGAKLNINSVVTKINGATTSILGTKIEVDGTNLSAKLSQQDTTIEGHTEKLSTQQSSITANTNAIKLKVDEQTYTSDKANMTSTLNKHTSEISTMKGQIALKVEQTDINNAKSELEGKMDTKITQAKGEIKVETDKITQSVSNLSSTVSNKADGSVVTNLSNKVSSLETSVGNIKGQVSSIETTTSKHTTDIKTATDKANSASTSATNAQNTANQAKTDATNANGKLSDIANDNKLTASEKQATKKEWDIILGEKNKIIADANTYAQSTTDYVNKFNALNTYITPLLSSLTTTSDITGTTFRSNFTNYYNARQDLLNAISAKAKTLADNAQNTANTNKGNISGLTTEISTTKSQVAELDINLKSITQRVSSTEKNVTTVTTTANNALTNANKGIADAKTANDKATTAQNTANTNKTEISNTKTKVASIETSLTGITQRVSNTENSVKTVDGKVVAMDTRLKSAEQKITEDAITSTVKKQFYTKTETDGKITTKVNEAKSEIKQTTDSIKSTVSNLEKGQSTLTQKVDGFEFKVESAGRANMLRNSDFSQGLKCWGNKDGATAGGFSGAPSTNGIVLTDCSGVNATRYVTQWMDIRSNSVGAYTFSGWAWKSSDTAFLTGSGRQPAMCSVYLEITYTDNTNGWYDYPIVDHIPPNIWSKFECTFEAPKPIKSILFYLYKRNCRGTFYATQLKAEEGRGSSNWTPSPNEVYSGVTTIDGEGVKVTHSNGDFTQMTSQGLKRHRSNGDAKGDYHYLTQYIGFSGQDTVWVQLKDDFKGKQFTAYSVISDTWEGSWNHGEPWVVQRFVTYVETDKIDYANARVPVLTYRIDKNYSTGAHRKMPCAGILLVVG